MVDLAFDISAFQLRPSPDYFASLAVLGYKLGWVQLWGLTPNGNGPNTDAAYQLELVRRAGMLTGGYIVIYPDDTDETDILVDVALEAAGSERDRLSFIATDVEPRTPLRMERLVNARQNIKAKGNGVLTPVYTSKTKWATAFGSPTVPYPFVDEDPLLEARYVLPSGSSPDIPPDLDWRWSPFGGWNERAMLQYAGTVNTLGVGIDRSVYDGVRLKLQAQPNEEEGDTMSSGEYTDILSRLAEVGSRLGNIETRLGTLESRVGQPPTVPVTYHTVVPGDTASAIAARYGISLAQLKALNPVAPRSGNWNIIYPGERFRVS